MQIPLVTHPQYSYHFPARHRFPMGKFELLHKYLAQVGIATTANTFRPGRCKQSVLELAHCPNYLARFTNNQQSAAEVRRMGLPWSEGLVRRTLISPNGTFLAANLALTHGIACHLAGGTHHAHFDFASGFCILNDLAITALALLQQQKIKRLLIFDCDVHQGDGTAAILQNTAGAFTCSIHCGKNFPARKAMSDLDIEVPVGTRDTEYLDVIQTSFEHAIERAKPDFILYDTGVDIYEHDPLGLLNISIEGIQKRDQFVLERCKSLKIPVATVIGGGYDNDQLELAKRHGIAVEQAARLWQ